MHVTRGLGAVLLTIVACAAAVSASPQFTLEVVRSASVESLDSLPAHQVEVVDRHLVIRGHFGLGATGYQLAPSGTAANHVVDLLVTAEMPADLAGLTVLTDYLYLARTESLAPGEWRLRVRHAVGAEGDPEVVFEQRVVVPR